MTDYIKIDIDGSLVDLPKEFTSLRLTYALKDRRGLATNTGSRSEYSFEFPATKQNDSIFNGFWDVGRQNADRQVFRPASIEVDGMPYFQGKAQLTSVTTQDNQYYWKGKRYKVAFYGNNADWVQDIREKKLYEYTLATHTFDNPTILAAYNQDYPTFDWGYTLIKWKDWNFSDKVQYQESTPFVYVRALMREIFDDIGYTINSNFLDTDFFERLILPIPLPDKFDGGFSDDYLTIQADRPTFLLSTYSAATPSILTNQTVSPAIGANPYNTGTGVYTAPYDGFYLFEYTAEITSVTGTGVGLVMVLGDLTAATLINASRVGDVSGAVYTSDTVLRGEYVVQMTAGQQVGLTHNSNISLGDANVKLEMRVTGELPVKDGVLIDFQYLIPKSWDSLGFIKGLAHAFNLVFQTNPLTREVTIEPADNYAYASESPTTTTVEQGFYNSSEDLTQKIDLLKEGEVTSRTDEPKSYKLGWQIDGQTEEALNEREDIGLLEGRYTFPINRYTKDEEVLINPFFAATLSILDGTIKSTNSKNFPQIPLIWSSNYLESPTSEEANYDIKPRLLIRQPYIDLSDRATIRIDNGAGGFNNVLCPLAYMVDYNNQNGERMSLSFGNTIVNNNEIKGLLDRFYLAEMKRRQVGKDLKVNLFWGLVDIMNLDFRNKVILKDDAYILQEVNSFDVLSDKSTKTYLQYAAQVETSDSDNVDSPEITNKVQ